LPKNYEGGNSFELVYEMPNADTRAEIVKKLVNASKEKGVISSGKFEVEKVQIAVKIHLELKDMPKEPQQLLRIS